MVGSNLERPSKPNKLDLKKMITKGFFLFFIRAKWCGEDEGGESVEANQPPTAVGGPQWPASRLIDTAAAAEGSSAGNGC